MIKGVYFVLGAVTGAVVTWFYLNKKYEARAEEEIESIRQLYDRYKEQEAKKKEPEEPPKQVEEESDDWHKYVEVINNRHGTTGPEDRPYVIPPEEFGLFHDYEQIELHYYNDAVLTDEDGEPVDDDIEDMIGEDFESHFGEYEPDAVFIRNDERKIDYEIIREDLNFNSAQEGG